MRTGRLLKRKRYLCSCSILSCVPAMSPRPGLTVGRGDDVWIQWPSRRPYPVGTVYTQTPDDSTIPNILGTLDLTTENIGLIAVGFGKATGRPPLRAPIVPIRDR